MKVAVVNTTSVDFVDENQLITLPANTTTEIDQKLWDHLFVDLSFIKNVKNNNFLINDGIKSIGYPASDLYLKDLLTYKITAIDQFNKVSWPILKSFANTRALPIIWSEDDISYKLKVFDGQFILDSIILKLPIENQDLVDFETNYKNNPKYKGPAVQQVSLTLADDGLLSAATATSFTANANTTTTHDFLLTEAFLFRGITFLSSTATIGDYVRVELVDKDNVMGFGPNTVLAVPVEKAFVQSTTNAAPIKAEDVSAAELPAPGLYLRIRYTNTASLNNVNVYLNLSLFKRKP